MTLDLSYHEAGGGPPLLILHGLFGNKRNWGLIVRALADDFRVLSLDLRNHGDSPWHEEMTYPAMARDVARFLETVIEGPAHILGHSMGGKVAMVLALTRPELVDRLIVADIPPAPRDSGLGAYVEAMQAVDVATMARRSEAEEALVHAIPERGIRSFLAQNLAPCDEGGLKWKLNLDVIGKSMAHIEDFPDHDSDQAFDRPALHLVGGNSEYVQPHHHAEIDRLFPCAAIETIEDADHWLHADRPGAFVRAVWDFLS